MPLRAKIPEKVEKRLKLFLFGPAGVGKTTAAVQFPKSYVIDGERGAENYGELLKKGNSVLFQSTDCDEIAVEVKTLLTEEHDYRTLVIDPVSTIYLALLEKWEKKVGADFGRHYGKANTELKRIVNIIMRLDMNVIITAHQKPEYGPGLVKLGDTFDAMRSMDYMFDLVLRLSKNGVKREATVVKTRLGQFPDASTFEFSYDVLSTMYGKTVMDRKAKTSKLATSEQVTEIKRLVEILKIDQEILDKWFEKASAGTWEEFTEEALSKCVTFCRNKIEGKEK